ncbi:MULTISPECIES: diguanylate cyclase domain-containing protein [unclassified Oceanispirochaeta]|uniref:diguanylate cyclase domain-containing protein n=1 Tax=unclassified Oceanispirochaeta TaxID=2635722 RepID=UPI000E09679D|nr:diguanylate cyclase [Oceanispirochaeta sp. M2]NPD75294.1 diguanylate cyclase [Oceanispirochaeta sp. M1]RDG28852.1 diguanylate cyclase [Oceanispirochaeta sp. M1]
MDIVSEKILSTVIIPFKSGPDNITVSCSIGIALSPDHGNNLEILIKNADKAMYCSKNSGKNRYTTFD